MLLLSPSDDLEIKILNSFVSIKHGEFLGQLKELLKKNSISLNGLLISIRHLC
jgi:hypothetical protein